MRAPDSLRIYLLDDHEVVRRGIRHLLESHDDLEVVGESGSAATARKEIGELLPDVAVLDLRLPDGSGIDVCRDVRAEHPEVNCLILTSFDDENDLIAALMAGATGVMLKEVEGASLINSIRASASGRSVLDASSAARVLKRMEGGTPELPTELASLSATEHQILLLIAEGLTNREIGERVFLAEKTVKNHVTSILAKLGLSRRTQAAVLVSRVMRSAS